LSPPGFWSTCGGGNRVIDLFARGTLNVVFLGSKEELLVECCLKEDPARRYQRLLGNAQALDRALPMLLVYQDTRR